MVFKTNGPPFSVATCEEFITYYKFYQRFPDTAGHLAYVLQKKKKLLALLSGDADLLAVQMECREGFIQIASRAKRNHAAFRGIPVCAEPA